MPPVKVRLTWRERYVYQHAMTRQSNVYIEKDKPVIAVQVENIIVRSIESLTGEL